MSFATTGYRAQIEEHRRRTKFTPEQAAFLNELRPMSSFGQRTFIYAIGCGGLAAFSVAAARRWFPRMMTLSRAQEFAIVSGMAIVPAGAVAKLEQRSHNRKMVELLSSYEIPESEANAALQEKETFAGERTQWLFNHRAQIVVGLGAVGVSTGIYTANRSTYMSSSAKAIRVRLFFSIATVGGLLFLCVISALTQESPKQRRRRSVKIE